MQVIPDGIPGLSEIASPALPLMQTLPFIVAMVALYFILFRPLLAYLEGREAATDGARKEAADLQVEVARRVEELDGRLAEAYAQGRAVRAEARSATLTRESALLAEARADADAQLQEALVRIQGERDEASTTLRSTAVSLARDIADQILGRTISA